MGSSSKGKNHPDAIDKKKIFASSEIRISPQCSTAVPYAKVHSKSDSEVRDHTRLRTPNPVPKSNSENLLLRACCKAG